jgi:O-antigen/teichoic acid export membrane protein
MAMLEDVPWIRGHFVRDTGTLAAGIVAAQAISLIVAPALTRRYTPDEFGYLAVFSALVGAVAVVACFAYEPAIVLPANDENAVAVLALSLLGVAAVTGTALVALLLWAEPLSLLLNLNEVPDWIWFVPVAVGCAGVFQAFNYWSTRHRQFRTLAVGRVTHSAAAVTVQLTGAGVIGLTLGAVVGQAIASIVLVIRGGPLALRAWRARSRASMTVFEVAQEYRRFPQYSSWASFMNSGAFHAVPLVLTSFFGSAAAGWYFLTYRVATLPLSLIGVAAGQVVLQRTAAQLARGESVAGVVERVLGKSMLLGAAPFVVLGLIAPQLFAAVFGEEWRESGSLLQVMVPLFFIQFLTSPVSMTLYSLQKQSVVAWIQAALFVAGLTALVAGYQLFDSLMASVVLYTGVQSVLYFTYLAMVIRYSAASPRMILREALTLR